MPSLSPVSSHIFLSTQVHSKFIERVKPFTATLVYTLYIYIFIFKKNVGYSPFYPSVSDNINVSVVFKESRGASVNYEQNKDLPLGSKGRTKSILETLKMLCLKQVIQKQQHIHIFIMFMGHSRKQ